MPRLVVFCGSRTGLDPRHVADTRALGHALAAQGHALVYGGGDVGLMGVLADAVLAAGGSVTGIIPHGLEVREVAHRQLTELIVVGSMHERKARMTQLADAFAALPGGFGTLDELFESLTWAQLGIHARPVGLLNSAGFFDPLLAMLDRMVDEGYLKSDQRRRLLAADSPDQLLDLLFHQPVPPAEAPWLEPPRP